MKTIFKILIAIFLLSCSDDPRDYSMKELYKDDYKQTAIEQKLTDSEKKMLEAAEQRYYSEDKGKELSSLTVRTLIEEQSKINNDQNFDKLTSIRLIDKKLLRIDSLNIIQWIVAIKNNSNRNIIRLQGWIRLIEPNSNEIIRSDTLDCELTVPSKDSIFFTTGINVLGNNSRSNRMIIQNSLNSINNMLDWTPLLIRYEDSTELLRSFQ